jgi:hypothetical protein
MRCLVHLSRDVGIALGPLVARFHTMFIQATVHALNWSMSTLCVRSF